MWTTTPEKARAAVAAHPRPSAEEQEAAALRCFGGGAVILIVPSPFAARVTAVASNKAVRASVKAGVYRPGCLREAMEILGAHGGDSEPWATREYRLSGTHDWSVSWSGYHAYYLAVARDGGYVPKKPLPTDYLMSGHVTMTHGQVVILSDWPEVRVHEPLGAVVTEFRDRTRIACIGRSPVNPKMVEEPHAQKAEDVGAETNNDLRSWAISRFAGPGTSTSAGWMRWLTEIGAEVTDERKNDIEGTHEALFRTSKECVLVATCPTKRIVAMTLPLETKTCAAAAEWLSPFGRAPLART
jgi:hypothetical protein